ncbi:zinc ribbon-containing protein [Halomonas daqiaonensis]|uniref:Zinc-ribbon containing domain-containing protein n=1 Tax=Halomonas daqiaonensis TaxID=650850 RepID=A0A1H7HEP1_9GAMM|nr:zinc ribbon-containing protein [Halomonas daqiaonensis]SEK48177.1 Zinc-ribbon containing domain-containing protein [Halomonas daqiaonensis]
MSEHKDPQQEHRLREGYERVLDRLREGADELTWDNLQQELDEAVEFEAELEEFTKDELSLLRAWVERDLKEMRRYFAAGGESVATWLGIDLSMLSRKVVESLLSIADRSVIEREQLEDDLEAARADYVEGEMAAPGRMACVHCDAIVELEGVTRIEPCHQCGHRYFVRAPKK